MNELPPLLREYTLPLWSKRPTSWLKERYAHGAWAFERGYRQNAPADEDRVFGDISKLLVHGVTLTDMIPVGSNFARYGGFDPAGETRIGNALVTSTLTDRGRRVITSMRLWRGALHQTISNLVLDYERHRWTLLLVENNGIQDSIIDAVVNYGHRGIPVGPFTTGRNKAHPELGVRGLSAEIVNEAWVLCMDDPYDTDSPLSEHEPTCACAYHEFLQDLTMFPSKTRTYDLLMAWWFCREAIRGSVVTERALAEDPADDVGEIPADEISGSIV